MRFLKALEKFTRFIFGLIWGRSRAIFLLLIYVDKNWSSWSFYRLITILEWTSLRPHLWLPESTTPPSAVCTVPKFDTAREEKNYHTHLKGPSQLLFSQRFK